MRLHRLEVTAFGPFAGTATVDFDALGAAGLFLLSGATGAGKTSVLDAVCFALYGAVPGERNDAKRFIFVGDAGRAVYEFMKLVEPRASERALVEDLISLRKASKGAPT